MSLTTATESSRTGTPRPALPVEDDRPAARHARRVWVYTQSVKGYYQKIHRATGLFLQAILVIVPWITVGGHPIFQADVPGRRLYALGSVFTPRETIFLVLMLLFSAFSLFFFTALFGRLWCGYACPQTVFLEEWVRPIERALEGDRGQRMARDRGPWTANRIGRKAAKWAAYAALAGVVAMSFMSWFAGARELWGGDAGVGYYGVTAALAGVMFLDFAWFREQFCNYLCPYARFQGALCDDSSLVVAYDETRGEPRKHGARKSSGGPIAVAAPGTPVTLNLTALAERANSPTPLGALTQDAPGSQPAPVGGAACIDCKKCVAVCPQGIDIRDGFQLECITCGRCIDACTGVMEKLGEPTLIEYTQLKKGPMIRPRTLVYGTLLFALATGFVALLADRHIIDANVTRAPGTLYTLDGDGWIRNTYLVRITNKDDHDETISVKIEGLPEGAKVDFEPVKLAGEESRTVPLIVRTPPGSVPGGHTIPLTVSIHSHDDEVLLASSFAGAS